MNRVKFFALIALILIISVSLLGCNPSDEQNYPADNNLALQGEIFDNITLCAEDYIKDEIDLLNNVRKGYQITDWQIDAIAEVGSGIYKDKNGNEFTARAYHLEYRLKPDDINKVSFAGAMEEENGWLLSTGMGDPYLFIADTEDGLLYLGMGWAQDLTFGNIMANEISIRKFLELNDLITAETFTGNHAIAFFTASTGETWKLLLSQPATQGEDGIWCVERWMDANGSIYYAMDGANIDMPLNEFYAAAQQEVNQKKDSDRDYSVHLDYAKVAYEFITDDIGHPESVVPFDSLTFVEPDAGTDELTVLEQFYTPHISTFTGYITNFTDDKDYFHFDRATWLTASENAEWLKELGVDPDSLPNGYYIHNPNSYPDYMETDADTGYYLLDADKNYAEYKEVSLSEFRAYIESFTGDFQPIFYLESKSGMVTAIKEIYQP